MEETTIVYALTLFAYYYYN